MLTQCRRNPRVSLHPRIIPWGPSMKRQSQLAAMAALACAVLLTSCVEERYDGPGWDEPILAPRDGRDHSDRYPGERDPRYEHRPRYPRDEPRPRYPREPRHDYGREEPRPDYSREETRPRYPRNEPRPGDIRGETRPRDHSEESRPRPPREEPRPPREEPRPPREEPRPPREEPRPPRGQAIDCNATPTAPQCVRVRRTGNGSTDSPVNDVIEPRQIRGAEERP